MARASSEALWRGRIAAQAKSGLSALAFCTQTGVSPKSFYAWRRRLKPARSGDQPALFVPVELPPHSTPAGDLRIELPGGQQIQGVQQVSYRVNQGYGEAASEVP